MEKIAVETSLPDLTVGVLQECSRVVRVSNPVLSVMGAITYRRGLIQIEERYLEWLSGIFREAILPNLLVAVELGGTEKGMELLELNSLMLTGVTPLLKESSARAGRILLQQGTPPGVKCLNKLKAAAENKETSVHFATVFGARCGIFSIGQRAAALAYVFQELRLGAPDWHDGILRERMLSASEIIEKHLQNNLQSAGTRNEFLKGRWHG